MAVTHKVYLKFVSNSLDKLLDMNSDTFKVMLCSSSYTPDQDAHDFKDDITNEIAASGGYSTGGATIANVTVTVTGGTNVIKIDGDDVAWSPATPTCRYGVIYNNTPGSDATRPVVSYIDFGADVALLSITWNASGIITFTVA